MMKSDYLSRQELAAILRLRVETLDAWAHRGFGPSFIKMGRGASARVLYRMDEVERFLAGCERRLSSSAEAEVHRDAAL